MCVCVCGEREIREEEERDFSDFLPGSVFILFTFFSLLSMDKMLY